MTIQVKDMHGNLQTLAWAQHKYGIEVITASPPTGAKVARLVKLQEVSGPSVQVVTVLDEQGKPVPGALVCQGWDQALHSPCGRRVSHGSQRRNCGEHRSRLWCGSREPVQRME